MMTRRERVKAALVGQKVDRIPMSVWMHFPVVDQDPRMLAETQVELHEKCELDFIKLMPFGLYSVQDWGCRIKYSCTETANPVVHKYAIDEAKDWEKVQALPAYFGTWGKQLLLMKYVKELLQDDSPVIQTIFSPMTTARKLAGDRIFDDMRSHPEIFHKAMKVITETTANFIRENIKLGADGFFFATQCATRDLMSDEEYKEFCQQYDLMLLEEANNGGWFNLLHMHGSNIRFKELANYPVHALNWHDRREYPTLKEARLLTNKCLIGGLDEQGAISKGPIEKITAETLDAIEQAGSTGLMLGPGCVAELCTPHEHISAVRSAINSYSY